MAFTLYNTLGRELQVFEPISPGQVGFYGCGPTVYNYAHIGNLRAYVLHDLLVKTLRRRGFRVTYVMNITDVGHLSGDNDSGDDKMVKSAGERGKGVLEIAEFYTQAFLEDTRRLNIDPPTVICKATEHIDEMIELIRRITDRGFTYSAGGNLYFDVSRFPGYGELALLRPEELRAGARLGVGVDKNKRNPQDFVLWFTKSKFENHALVWDSPWGRGYPGWHIECSAMSIKYLGEQFDIHAGGIDHIPIHHTNEIAQSEAASGLHPWVRYWIHNEFIVMDKGKMSKAAGGFLTLQGLIEEGYDPLDYRYFLLGGHYRSQMQFSFEALNGARNARRSLLEKIRSLAPGRASLPGAPEASKTPGARADKKGPGAAAYREAFDAALDEDLSTPKALAVLWTLIRDPSLSPADALAAAFDMDQVLGLGLEAELRSGGIAGGAEEDPEAVREIEALIAERKEAKKRKDFAAADKIRDTLKSRGIVLEDGLSGTLWRRG